MIVYVQVGVIIVNIFWKKNTEVESILKSIEENITIWRIEISEYNNQLLFLLEII